MFSNSISDLFPASEACREVLNRVAIQSIVNPLLDEKNIRLDVLRLDQVDTIASGNKWFKLMKHFDAFEKSDAEMIVSCGGQYSNHLHALAYYCQIKNIPCHVIAPENNSDKLTPTMQDIKNWGAQIHFVSRSEYRQRHEKKSALINTNSAKVYWVEEGASDDCGLLGVQEMTSLLQDKLEEQNKYYDGLILACGTSTTACAVMSQWRAAADFFLVSALPSKQLRHQLENNLRRASISKSINWEMHFNASLGGIGVVTDDLKAWVEHCWQSYELPLDSVYTSKAMLAWFEAVDFGQIKNNSDWLMIHTGGLQGIRGVADWPFTLNG